MFRSKKKLALTNDAYSRWLRAQRPPFWWFLELTEQEQECLAMLGEAHVLQTADDLTPKESEEDMVRRLVSGGVQSILQKTRGASPPPPPTTEGIKKNGGSLFGKAAGKEEKKE